MNDAAELVARYGSPLYVYDLDRLEAARDDLFAALPDSVGVYFSLKANPHPVIARHLRTGDQPCRAEVCSRGELESAIDAGYPPAEILYGGPGKTAAEIELALKAGVRTMSVESPGDLRRIGALATARGMVVDCLLRLNAPDAESRTSIRMTGVPSQFGIDVETLPDVMPALRSVAGTRLVGAHVYPLSNARDEQSLIAEFQHSIELAATLSAEHDLPVRQLDLGGGFAAPYASAGHRPVYDKLADELAHALDVAFPHWRAGTPQVHVESGRYLTGDCGTLLTSVTNVKHSRGTRFVVLDAGINTFGGMAGLGRMLPVGVEVRTDETTAPASLAGPLCTPGDLLGRNVAVPDLAEGDVLAIPNAGAYGASASLRDFLSRPSAGEVFVQAGEVVAATRTLSVRLPIGG